MKDLESKWENGRLLVWSSSSSKWNDVTNTLTIPELYQAILDKHLSVFQGLVYAYLLDHKNK